MNIPVVINNRLKSTLGWCRKTKIELSQLILIDPNITDDTLLHELCHWYCGEIGEDDKDGDKFFEDTLRKVGDSSTESTTFTNGEWKYLYRYGVFKCECCNKEIITKDYTDDRVEGKVGNRIKIYNCCSGKMKFSGVRTIEEKYILSSKIEELNQKFKVRLL